MRFSFNKLFILFAAYFGCVGVYFVERAIYWGNFEAILFLGLVGLFILFLAGATLNGAYWMKIDETGISDSRLFGKTVLHWEDVREIGIAVERGKGWSYVIYISDNVLTDEARLYINGHFIPRSTHVIYIPYKAPFSPRGKNIDGAKEQIIRCCPGEVPPDIRCSYERPHLNYVIRNISPDGQLECVFHTVEDPLACQL